MIAHSREGLRGYIGARLGTIIHVETDKAVIALTFDDGPNDQYTPALLDVLEKHDAQATFFALGKNLIQHADLAEDMIRRGHEIANHSWSHPPFPKLTLRMCFREIRKCDDAIPGKASKLFRFPYGHESLGAHMAAAWLGRTAIGWNLNTSDWNGSSEAEISQKMREHLQPGSIVLLHDDLHEPRVREFKNRQATVNAVDIILSEFKGRYRFTTVTELLRTGAPVCRIMCSD